MTEPADDGDELSEITDDFLRRLKAGENPDIEAYAAQYPELAGKLRMFLPLFQGMRSPQSDAQAEPAPLSEVPAHTALSSTAPSNAAPSNAAPAVARPTPPDTTAPASAPQHVATPTSPPGSVDSRGARAWATRAAIKRRYLAAGATGAAIAAAIVVGCLISNSGTPAGVSSGTPAPPGPPSPERYVDSAGHRFVRIPHGKFRMGSSQADIQAVLLPPDEPRRAEFDRRLACETPARDVQLTRPFDLGEREVTVKEFRRFVTETGYTTEAEKNGTGSGWNREQGRFETDPKYNWRNPGWDQVDDEPVVLVSWFDAVKFCNWKSKVEKQTYRLPTEAEWEFVRAHDTHPILNPDTRRPLANVADLTLRMTYTDRRNVELMRDGHLFTSPVASFPPNHYGLLDLTGNVYEWCSDRYAPDYQAAAAVDPVGPADGTLRVTRGGSWNRSGVDLRVTSRATPLDPSQSNAETGFRLARDVAP